MSNQENPVIKAAQDYQRATAHYVTMRDLGTLLGVSSHAVGRKLKEVGLRDSEGQPTEKAKTGGFIKSVFLQETFPLIVWQLEKTLAVLRPLIQPK